MKYYVLKGGQSNTIYAIYKKYKNRKFVLQQKTELEQQQKEPINLFID